MDASNTRDRDIPPSAEGGREVVKLKSGVHKAAVRNGICGSAVGRGTVAAIVRSRRGFANRASRLHSRPSPSYRPPFTLGPAGHGPPAAEDPRGAHTGGARPNRGTNLGGRSQRMHIHFDSSGWPHS